MPYIEISPPGTWCQIQATLDAIRLCSPTSNGRFLEAGCGRGELSQALCGAGWKGTGLDFSPEAIRATQERLRPHLASGAFTLIQQDVGALVPPTTGYDVAVSMMVLEHVSDEVDFLKRLSSQVRSNGHVVVGVPGRKDLWSQEDEEVGHLRRYDRADLLRVMRAAGLKDVQVWSVSVPISNLLYFPGRWLFQRASIARETSSKRQTQLSGVHAIPFKTVYPGYFRWLLNRYTMSPLFLLQRFFYRTELGLTLIAFGRVE